ncbi:MAG: carbamoyltransferase HypF [Vulcanimicrobiaceae bacterium]
MQGVGFRPFAFRLARRYALDGWVRNGEAGVEMYVEGAEDDLDAFERALRAEAPPAARIAAIESSHAAPAGIAGFTIRDSTSLGKPTVRIAPDIATCDACLREMSDPANRRYRYPYINCTDCGPRYSIVLGLPYDRPLTTMAAWAMCADCRAEYDDPADRRFHAQPIACHVCGPAYAFERDGACARGDVAIVAAAHALADGAVVAVKGIGGYHLACDARNARAVAALRERKFRKERPFAVMTRDLTVAETLVALDEASRALLASRARPIVLAPARGTLAGVAPDNRDLGVMLPYAPLHALLFDSGAPDALVLTSGNRSSEPIAYRDDDARATLAGIADSFLIGERPIGRRVDDSIARTDRGVPAIVRRSRGFAPEAVARVPPGEPILAVGGDLKNAVALVVGDAVIVSQHVGDLAHLGARDACAATVRDLCATYGIDPAECLVAHDAHPEYASSALAHDLSARTIAVQHHRAHVASIVAERAAWTTDVLGLACDGTGYGDDGTIWGGECFTGSIAGGFTRIAHLRPAKLPGGDAAARMPVQAAAGFLLDADDIPDLAAAPFYFPARYRLARELALRDVRTYTTTSLGRLFDVAAALCGFTRETTFEGQAAMWLEHLARGAATTDAYPFPLAAGELDFRPLLRTVIAERSAGRDSAAVARAFHTSVADGLAALAGMRPHLPVAASGGVFQNTLLCELLRERLGDRLWLAERIPANDGGICVGQAALASFAPERATCASRGVAPAGVQWASDV